ncbi:hypothetical protein SLEP1_g22658 [Rubroshorea leprosula]|uniref:Reverse transcriptase domain-containing protein n=1 Tax=Rubroshorea leprosula TaxID=152421 RepID=A0AAV5JLV1_9ROSI|nr:hypothetical protein SLEP1_g22658 [Rubroshorea leprosula]
MASAFATKFSRRRLIRKTTSKLMRVKQREGESLKNYMSWFNDAVLKVSSFNQAVGIVAIIQVVTPHNDPLVTSVMINNCERYDGPIYGFNNQPVQIEGVLTLNVAFRSGRTYVTLLVRFLVVKMASSFNAIIGQPTLIEIRAVVSQSHLYMKFPTPMGIATLRGNQEVGRHCYITSVTRPQKGKEQTLETVPQQIHDTQQVMGVEIVDNRPEDKTRAALVEDVEEVQIDDRDQSRKTQIGTWLNPKEIAELIALLQANKDNVVTIVFRAQISKNLEVYIDDIVVKSLKAEDHLADLDETFHNLRKNRMRLNSGKCIFGVEFRKFLGFMVSWRGIEVNPEKIKEIAKMELPKSVNDIQRLTGRVADLHRFISKSVDKCLPFFKIMRSAA